MNVEVGKKYKTRSGNEVVIYAVHDGDYQPLGDLVHGAVLQDGTWRISSWHRNGARWLDGGTSSLDLVEAKERVKVTLWLNIHKDGEAYAYDNAKAAKSYRSKPYCIACVKVEIDVEKGSGL